MSSASPRATCESKKQVSTVTKSGSIKRSLVTDVFQAIHPAFFSAIFLVVFGLTAPFAAEARPPNIVLILADDLGYGDLGCYGSEVHVTPHIDALAAAGVRFTDFHSAGPMCSPTRAATLTGLYQQRFGRQFDTALSGVHDRQTGLPDEAVTIAELLKPRGYATACFGKWASRLPATMVTKRTRFRSVSWTRFRRRRLPHTHRSFGQRGLVAQRPSRNGRRVHDRSADKIQRRVYPATSRSAVFSICASSCHSLSLARTIGPAAPRSRSELPQRQVGRDSEPRQCRTSRQSDGQIA